MSAKYTLEQELVALKEIKEVVDSILCPLTVLQLKRKGKLTHSLDVISRICKKYSIPGIIYGKEASHINKSNAAVLVNKFRQKQDTISVMIDTEHVIQKKKEFLDLYSKNESWNNMLQKLSLKDSELRWLCNDCDICKTEISKNNIKFTRREELIRTTRELVYSNYTKFDFPLTIKQLSKHLKVSCDIIEKAVSNFDFIIRGNDAKQIDEEIKRYNYSEASKRNTARRLITQRNNCLKKYGVEWYTQTKQFIDLAKETKIKRYGYATFNNRDKCKNTLLEKYGVDNVMKIPEVKEKAVQTNLERYGETNPSKSKEIIDKISATSQEKYNVEFPCLSPNCLNKNKVCYEYNSIIFDSKWELCYYIANTLNNVTICRYTGDGFEYVVGNEKHRYFPDFIVNEKLVEIKGPHFIDELGNLINPFTNDYHLQQISIEKGKLMNTLGVVVITNVDKEINIVRKRFGDSFIESCKKG